MINNIMQFLNQLTAFQLFMVYVGVSFIISGILLISSGIIEIAPDEK